MWYFNGSKFSNDQEKLFKSILSNSVLSICDSYQVVFPEGKFDKNNSFFNGYEILVKNNNASLIKVDSFETGNWLIYGGNFNDYLRAILSKYLKNKDIFSIKFILNELEIFEINDFNEYLIKSKDIYEKFIYFKDIIDEIDLNQNK